MPAESAKIDFTPIEIPKQQGAAWGVVKIALVLFLLAGAVVAWQTGYLHKLFAGRDQQVFQLVEVDRGDIDISVIETGTVEERQQRDHSLSRRSAPRAGRRQSGGDQQDGRRGRRGRRRGWRRRRCGRGCGRLGRCRWAQQTTAKAKTTKKAGSSSTAKSGSASTSKSSTTSGSGTTGTSSGSGTSGSSGTSTSGSGGSTATGNTTTVSKPVMKSFTYTVVAYVPARPATTKAVDTTAQKKAQGQGGGGGGGGGGRGGGGGGGGRGGGGGGRGGGRGGMFQMDESPGSTTIVYLIPEGSPVKAGELVCKLDSSAFEDEEKAQLIRYVQAKSYVEQATNTLEVAKISLREYRDGIYPQDMQLIKQYIEACELDRDRLKRAAIWSLDMYKKGYRTDFQAKGDQLAYDQTIIALGEATNMLSRLTNQTGPKILKSLEANVKAIEADKLTQEAAFNLEQKRLDRIRKNIKNCTLTAPTDGIVVYANQTSAFGTVTVPITEGATVRQDQPIINLPDPLHMRVKARINESKLSFIRPGQSARIVVDAFRERPLKGKVGQVTAINTPLNASDVRVYYANVDITQGFGDLRPGLSAEVAFLVEKRHDVTRVPLDAIRWVHDHGFVAIYDHSSTDVKQKWRWKEIQLGASDVRYAEVLTGLEPGDRVVASPRELLPAPRLPPRPPGRPASPKTHPEAHVDKNLVTPRRDPPAPANSFPRPARECRPRRSASPPWRHAQEPPHTEPRSARTRKLVPMLCVGMPSATLRVGSRRHSPDGRRKTVRHMSGSLEHCSNLRPPLIGVYDRDKHQRGEPPALHRILHDAPGQNHLAVADSAGKSFSRPRLSRPAPPCSILCVETTPVCDNRSDCLTGGTSRITRE